MAFVAAGAPPCCTGCDEYDRSDGICRLLADPTIDNRKRLLTMPCDVQKLLRLRFRAHGAQGEDVAGEAVLTWLSPGWDPDDISASYGKAPRDARLWLTSWPYLYLGRNAVRRMQREGARQIVGAREEVVEPRAVDPTLAIRAERAIEKVHRVDPVGYAMLLDFLHDRFDAEAWAASLSLSAASVSDRKYLGLYRYAVYFYEVLESLAPHEAAIALGARRFSPGDPGEHTALAAVRTTLGQPALSMARFRQLYREGAVRSLAMLAAPEAVGAEIMATLGPSFRRVLRVE
ncbi:MAG: hypothetical protein U0359_30680 [Byssovorax sp.]